MSDAQFNKAVELIGKLPKNGPVTPSVDDQLIFYKYFKQGTIGDVNIARPGMMDFTGKAKWDAWKSVEGTSQDDAKAAYVKAFLELLNRSEGEESKALIAQIDAVNV